LNEAERPRLTKEKRFRQAEKVTIIGIVTNILLTILKFFAGIVGNSHALIADATESLSDVISTTAVLVSFKISKKPKDKNHPYGHGKAESIATSIVGLIIMASGFLILFTDAGLILSGDTTAPKFIALAAALLTLVIKEILHRYVLGYAKRLDSSVLMASAMDYRKDVISKVATIIGITGAMVGFPFLDPLAAIFVSFIIIGIGLRVVIRGSRELMDTSLEQPILDKMIAIAKDCEGVEHAYGRARRMGQFISAEIIIDIDPSLTVSKGHSIAKKVKVEIMKELENVSDVMVHVNPHE